MNTFKVEVQDHADYFVYLMKLELRNKMKWGFKDKAEYLGRLNGMDCAEVSIDKPEMEVKKAISNVLDKWHFEKVRIRPMVSQDLNKIFDAVERVAYDMGVWS